ncbi:MAG: M20/M25/M40 family metallo-hydrolase [Bacteroidetes bacterium]|nr:M20/M25/M40 family metallo-hydrolase [Bacteroidota bacterium]
MKKLVAALLAIIPAFSIAQNKSDEPDLQMIARIKQEEFSNSKVMETLFQLTDVNGPRLTGSPGMRHAQIWLRQQFQDWGLANAAIEPWGSFGKGWQVDKCYVAMTAPYYQPLIAVPRAWTPGTNGLIKADAISVKIDDAEDMEKYKGKLAGKIVVFEPPVNTATKSNFVADAKRLTEEDLEKMDVDPHLDDEVDNPSKPDLKNTREARIALMKKRDSFLLAERPLAVLTIGSGGSMGTVFTTNGARWELDAKPVLPGLEVSREHINRIVRLLDAGKQVSLELETKTTFFYDSIENNVVAEIPGTDKNLKSELVMLGGHMDSWHAATGTTDNGTGSAVAIEAIRILKALDVKPRRTIRVVLWSGEEQGLLGSHGYVKNHFGEKDSMKFKPEYEKVSAYFNLDNGAGKIRGIYLQGNDMARPIFESWMEPFRDMGATTVTIRNTGGTDHLSFDEIGIPGFQFIQDPLDYGTRTHHTNMDSYDRVNSNDLKQASIIMATFVYQAAMRDEKIPRKPMVVKKK